MEVPRRVTGWATYGPDSVTATYLVTCGPGFVTATGGGGVPSKIQVATESSLKVSPLCLHGYPRLKKNGKDRKKKTRW